MTIDHTPSASLPEDAIDPLDLYRLPSTEILGGRTFTVTFAGGGSLVVELGDGADSTAHFSAVGMPEQMWPTSGQGAWNVVEVRAGLYLLDIDVEAPASDGLTLALLTGTGWALAVYQRREVPEELWSRGPDVSQDFRVGTIDGQTPVGSGPALTRDLVGARNLMLMGPENLYEHLYVNTQKIFVHHVHTNVATGKCERHPATFYRLADGLYLIGFREMDNAAGMIIVEDYETRRMTGKVLHPVSMFESRSRYLGGKLVPVNGAVSYPDGLDPV